MNPHTDEILSKFPYDTTYMNISDKNIKGLLDLSGYHLLEYLYCANNEITELYLSKKLKLIEFDCSNNQLKKIIINSHIDKIKCNSNPFEQIKISQKYDLGIFNHILQMLKNNFDYLLIFVIRRYI